MVTKPICAKWSWSHSLEDYQAMFDLSVDDLSKKILDCAGGTSSFNAQMYELGKLVTSCDMMYGLEPNAMSNQAHSMVKTLLEHIETLEDYFDIDKSVGIQKFFKQQLTNADLFIEDYPIGYQEGRYIQENLLTLSLPAKKFDLALCANFLFDGHQQLSFSFCKDVIEQILKTAKELRIYPLSDDHGNLSPMVLGVIDYFKFMDYETTLYDVDFSYYKTPQQMLKISSAD